MDASEFFTGLIGEGADAGVVQVGRQLALALAFHLVDLLLLPLQVREGAEIDIKYSGYLQRQQQQIDQVKRQSQRKLPADLDYAGIGTLSNEAREKLTAIQPSTLGQASRIPGVSQADITALLMWLELRQRQALAPPAEAR